MQIIAIIVGKRTSGVRMTLVYLLLSFTHAIPIEFSDNTFNGMKFMNSHSNHDSTIKTQSHTEWMTTIMTTTLKVQIVWYRSLLYSCVYVGKICFWLPFFYIDFNFKLKKIIIVTWRESGHMLSKQLISGVYNWIEQKW